MTRRLRSLAVTGLVALLVCLTVAPAAARDSQKARWLKIRVYHNGADTPSVLVNLPMSLVSAFLRVAGTCEVHARIDRAAGDERPDSRSRDLDLEALVKTLETMEPGQIVEVQEDDERVSIGVE